MTNELLQQANELKKKIDALKVIGDCFEFNAAGKTYSLNPLLIIEFDGPDGREQRKVPLAINYEMHKSLMKYVKEGIESAENEFNNL
jgi:hypothetical protein